MLAELGQTLGKNGDPEGEIQAYRTALQLRPGDPRSYLQLADALNL
jgi:cytochrome c-type biogenesis protein CcmH/NrfG